MSQFEAQIIPKAWSSICDFQLVSSRAIEINLTSYPIHYPKTWNSQVINYQELSRYQIVGYTMFLFTFLLQTNINHEPTE